MGFALAIVGQIKGWGDRREWILDVKKLRNWSIGFLEETPRDPVPLRSSLKFSQFLKGMLDFGPSPGLGRLSVLRYDPSSASLFEGSIVVMAPLPAGFF
jgi:hypothetical protein